MPGILGNPRCPISRTLDVVGDRWTLLIVRDAVAGSTRFSQFRDSLGIPKDVLATRLDLLVDTGVLDRRSYRAEGARTRDEYVLTDAGHDLLPVLGALGDWGLRHRPISESPLVSFVDESGVRLGVGFVGSDGRAVAAEDVLVSAG
jgi:DNA-binding HxlR family transcriptional regulator